MPPSRNALRADILRAGRLKMPEMDTKSGGVGGAVRLVRAPSHPRGAGLEQRAQFLRLHPNAVLLELHPTRGPFPVPLFA